MATTGLAQPHAQRLGIETQEGGWRRGAEMRVDPPAPETPAPESVPVPLVAKE